MAAIPRDARVFVAGHAGLVGSAVVDRLKADGFTTILTATRSELDLRDQAAVHRWFHDQQPEYVFLVAGTVGGIMANSTRPAEFLYDNMLIHGTVVEASKQVDVAKLLYLGSSCIYPRQAHQPITEDQLLTGPLEPTNEAYALAKITGIKLCEAYRRQYGCNFISAMPTNLYGPGDNFDPVGGHLVPMLMRRFHEAREASEPKVEVWGTGSPRRELLHVADLADACLYLMDNYEEAGHINVGTGEDIAIRDLAELAARHRPSRRRARLRHHQARRHAPQGARRVAPPRPRLAPPHLPAGGPAGDLPVVPRPGPGRRARALDRNPLSRREPARGRQRRMRCPARCAGP